VRSRASHRVRLSHTFCRPLHRTGIGVFNSCANNCTAVPPAASGIRRVADRPRRSSAAAHARARTAAPAARTRARNARRGPGRRAACRCAGSPPSDSAENAAAIIRRRHGQNSSSIVAPPACGRPRPPWKRLIWASFFCNCACSARITQSAAQSPAPPARRGRARLPCAAWNSAASVGHGSAMQVRSSVAAPTAS